MQLTAHQMQLLNLLSAQITDHLNTLDSTGHQERISALSDHLKCLTDDTTDRTPNRAHSPQRAAPRHPRERTSELARPTP